MSSSVLLVIALVTLTRAQFHHPSQFRSQAVVNSGFIPSVQQDDDDKQDDSTPSAAINYRQSAQPSYSEYEEEEEEVNRPTVPNQIRRQQPSYIRPQQQQIRQQVSPPSKNRFEEELEPEEPDRLALALEKSTFQCEGRTGLVAKLDLSIIYLIDD